MTVEKFYIFSWRFLYHGFFADIEENDSLFWVCVFRNGFFKTLDTLKIKSS